MRFNDLTGKIFGELTVVQLHGRNKHNHFIWLLKCSCGNETTAPTSDLVSTKIVSCGCHKRKLTVDRNTKHGLSKTTEYRSWKAMKTRCYNPKVKSYADYGARGIKVCDRWLESFENFIADMGFKPHPSYSIDRLENNGDYEPGNCRWASKKEQNSNTRQNHFISTKWGELTLAQASEKSGVSLSTIKDRIKRGIPENQLLLAV